MNTLQLSAAEAMSQVAAKRPGTVAPELQSLLAQFEKTQPTRQSRS
jgi:hypothetical protein